MGFLTVLILSLSALNIQLVFGEVWEFGENDPISILIFQSEGKIKLLEKTKSVQIAVPKCHEVTYIRVEVNNLVSNPAVFYSKDTQIVTISYKPLQVSLSTYQVVAKGRKKWCTEDGNESGNEP